MGLAEFGLQGVSAGAKYVLATVLEVPERVTGATLVSSFGAADDPALRQAALRIRLALGLYRDLPALGRLATAATGFLLRHATAPFLRASMIFVPQSEREMLAASDAFDTTADVLRAAACQGAAGIDEEFRLLLAPWNLPLGDIRRPVTLWHGNRDVVAPMAMAENLAAAIPGSVLHRVPGLGHLSLLAVHASEIMSTA